ncbi:MAG: LysE family translocator [Hyphomicrobiaceae bacterium]
MTADILLAFTGFAFVTSVTPGPNNMMLLASGVNHGFRRTIPHMLGVSIGFVLMVVLVGLGLGQLLEANPTVYGVLKIVSLVYMVWLAWRIATSGPIAGEPGESSGRPMTFIEAALFQWVNPKAWAMALTATAAYTTPANFLPSLLLMGLIFGIINLPSVGVWTLCGVGLRRLLQTPRFVRIFNVSMAILLIVSMLPAVLAAFSGRG